MSMLIGCYAVARGTPISETAVRQLVIVNDQFTAIARLAFEWFVLYLNIYARVME